MEHQRLEFLTRAAGCALLVAAGGAAQAQTFISGPAVSSTGAGGYTVFARQDDGRLYAVDQQQFYLPGFGGRPPIQFWQRSGWNVVPGGEDINSDPDSTMDHLQQWVVARKSDNDCWFTTRPVSETGPGAWSGIWSKCDVFNPFTFTSGIAAAAVNNPAAGVSAIHMFGRGTDGGIYHNTIVDWQGLIFGTNWTIVPGMVDGSIHLGPVTDFTGDPDAVAYATPEGTKVAVCAQRIPDWDPVGRSTGVQYCNTYSPNTATWSGWGAASSVFSQNYTGPGVTPKPYASGGYDVYYWRAVPLVRYQIPGQPFGIAGSHTLPNRRVSADPDAATFTDLFRGNALSEVVCTRDTSAQIVCSLWDGSAFGAWFAP